MLPTSTRLRKNLTVLATNRSVREIFIHIVSLLLLFFSLSLLSACSLAPAARSAYSRAWSLCLDLVCPALFNSADAATDITSSWLSGWCSLLVQELFGFVAEMRTHAVAPVDMEIGPITASFAMLQTVGPPNADKSKKRKSKDEDATTIQYAEQQILNQLASHMDAFTH